MSDANILIFGNALGGGTIAIPDNNTSALEIDSIDAEKYITLDTTDDASKVVLLGTHTEADNQSSGMVGIRETTPKAPLHVVGTGGSTGMSIDPTAANSPTIFIENSNNNSKDRCSVAINGDGNSGASVDLYQADTRRLGIGGFSSGAILFTETVPLEISASSGSGQHIKFTAGGSEALRIDNDRKITTGGETTPLCAANGIHLFESDTGVTLSGADGADMLIIESNESDGAGLTILTDTNRTAKIHFSDEAPSGKIEYNHSTNTMSFYAFNNERLTIKSGGFVGIGKTAPDTALHVHDDNGGHITISGNAATDTVGVSFESLSGTRYGSLESNGNTGVLKLRSGSTETGGGYSVQLASGGSSTEHIGLILSSTGKLSTGGETTSLGSDAGSLHIKTGDSAATSSDVHADADDLIVEGSGNSGISILTPTNGKGCLYFIDENTGGTPDGIAFDQGTGSLRFQAGNSERVRIDGSGNMGIAGTPSGSHKLEVTGTAGLSTGTAWTNTSDSRIKKDVQEITDGLEKIKQLRPVSFQYTDDYLSVHSEIDGSKRFNSFIAEEYESVFPDAVTVQGNLEKEVGPEQFETLLENVKQFTPHDLNMYLVAAVKQLLTRIEVLENGD